MFDPVSIGLGLGGAALNAISSKNSNDAQIEAAAPQAWDPARPAIDQIMANSDTIYQNQGYAPDPTQPQLYGRQNQYNYATQQLPNYVDAAQNSWLQGLSGQINPYTTQMIQAAQNDMIQDYERNIMPSIASRAVGAGGYGGARHGVAQGLASEALMESMGDVSSTMLNSAWDTGQRQQQAAWNSTPNMLNTGLMPGQVMQDVGAQYQNDQTAAARNLTGHNNQLANWTGLSNTNPGQLQNVGANAIAGAKTGYALGQAYNQGNSGLPANYSTQWGTIPGSQQTQMLQQQNAGFTPFSGGTNPIGGFGF